MAPPRRTVSSNVGREGQIPAKVEGGSFQTTAKSQTAGNPSSSTGLPDSMSKLQINEKPPASKNLNEQAKTNIKRAGIRLDDDQTHISSSSNTAPSLDGKSTTSGTTFALDEKESLRPDDSASAKAVEDEDSVSGLASGAPNSRVGSEAGGRAFRDQFSEVNESVSHAQQRSHPFSRRIVEGIEEEGPKPSAQPPLIPVMNVPASLPLPEIPPPMQPPMDFLYRGPDEKLFEALESPKDRFFLLRLEEDIIRFIKTSSEPKMELPPCNSFCRLLAHKLADYYALTHFVDNAVSSVTLYRTPYCRIPTPLSEVAKSRALPATTALPAPLPAMKIMRRPGIAKDNLNADSGAGTTESSAFPSKAGSEAGEDSFQGTGVISPTESTTAKDKMSLTREEREARYKEKREELFGPQAEETDSAESIKEVSRTSSRNEKKRKKAKKDDDFEARSQFNAYYPSFPVNAYNQANGSAAFYAQYGYPAYNQAPEAPLMGLAMPQQVFQPTYQNPPNPQIYSTFIGQVPPLNGYGAQPQILNTHNTQGFNQQTPTPLFAQPLPQNIGMAQSSSAISSPAMSANAQLSRPQSQMSEQQWTTSLYTSPYQPVNPQPPVYPSTSPTVPYPYGQLPFQPVQQNGRPAHPLPGSYSRPAFNPQTRAFVPSGNLVPPPNNGFLNSNGLHANGHAASMMRSGSMTFSNSGGHSPVPQQPSFPSVQYSAPYQEQLPKAYGSGNRKGPNQSQPSASTNDTGGHQSSLSKWGTPANLPPKPPPPQTASLPDGQHALPTNNQFGVNMQIVNGGQPMPSFQNGIYSMPGIGGP